MFFNEIQLWQIPFIMIGSLCILFFLLYKIFRYSKEEYEKLIQLSHHLQSLDTDLLHNIAERTKHIEQLLMKQKSPEGEIFLHQYKDCFFQNCKKFHLTSREESIVLLIKKGQTYKMIGEQLFISDKTVAKHIQHIFEKVCVNNKVELIHKLSEMILPIENTQEKVQQYANRSIV